MAPRPTIALVSREVWPFVEGGGIGRYVHASARLLAPLADVTVVLPGDLRGALEPRDSRLPDGVQYVFAPEADPERPEPFLSIHHAWSAAAWQAVRALCGDRGPDLVEFPDYAGEGAVTVQAKRSGDPALRRTRVVLGVHGTDELNRALNGRGLGGRDSGVLAALERVALAGADALLDPGGDVYGTYRRFYGEGKLAPSCTGPAPFVRDAGPAPPAALGARPVRVLHLGRYERRKGVDALVRAAVGLERDDFTLTLVGRDTPTGPGGGSMRERCERLAAGDPRIRFRGPVGHSAALAALAEHDVLVIPSPWECNPTTAREAIMLGRPVLATPTGALTATVEEGVSGWLAEGSRPAQLGAALRRVLDDRPALERLLLSGEVARRLDRIVRDDETRERYLDEAAPGGQHAAASPGGVVVVVVARGDGGSVAETLRSLAGQTVPPQEIAVRCDSRGVARAVRALAGSHQIRVDDGELPCLLDDREPGAELVCVLDAGTVVAPRFLERTARALGADAAAAYATTWSNAPEPAVARPLGNEGALIERDDCGGEVLVVRREDAARAVDHLAGAELGGAGAWLLARELSAEGRRGTVVPEELVTGCWAPARAPAPARREEVEAALRRHEVEWTAPAGRTVGAGGRGAASGEDGEANGEHREAHGEDREAHREPHQAHGEHREAGTADRERRAGGAPGSSRRSGAGPAWEPRLSVLMAAHDAEDTIPAAVESALAQSEERLELIVVDDGSHVPAAEVLADFRDQRLVLLRHRSNRGLGAARNTALARARAPLVSQLDADDVWAPDYASTLIERFEDPAVGLAYSNAWLVGHPDGQDAIILDPSVHPMDRFPKFAEQNPVPSLTAMMRTAAVRAAGGYATWLRGALDYYLYAKLIMAGWRFAYVDRRLAWYRWPERGRGMSFDRRATELSEVRMWLAFVARHPRVPGPRRQVRLRLKREARLLLRREARPFLRRG